MSSPVIAISSEANILDAVRIMIENSAECLIMCDNRDCLVGILTFRNVEKLSLS